MKFAGRSKAAQAWFDMHEYERAALAIVHAHGTDGYVPPEGALKTGGACDRLAEVGYLRRQGGRFWLNEQRCRPFLYNLERLAADWAKIRMRRSRQEMLGVSARAERSN